MAGLIFLNGAAVNHVSAQTLKTIRVDVPFDFHVGDKTFPAGVYYLESISRLSNNLLQLRSFETKKQRLLVTDDLYSRERHLPKLVFHRIGEEHYLSNIFMSVGTSGFSIRAPRRVETAKKLASTKTVEVPVN
jgi:hypothetical protein